MNTEIVEREPDTALFQPPNLDELLDSADAEAERLIEPVARATDGLLTGSGDNLRAVIRSERSEQAASDALGIVRRVRKDLDAYWKQDPRKPADERRAGEGWIFLVNKVKERLYSTFNKRDKQLQTLDAVIDRDLRAYRAEQARKAQAEAEAKAAAEHARLVEEARQERLRAEEERSRLERIAQEERRKAEEEAERRRQAELALARTKREKEEVERRAREATERAAREEEQERQKAERVAAEMRQEAEELEQEALDVVPEAVEVAKPIGYSSRKVWKAEVTDFMKLVKAVAEGKAPLNTLLANDSGLNKLAEAWGGQNPPPGVRFVSREISTTRQRR